MQILHQLKAAGIVQSARGAIGGYRLTRKGTEISVADVLAAIEGPGEPSRDPTSPAARILISALEKAHAARWDLLVETTIAELAISPDAPHDHVL